MIYRQVMKDMEISTDEIAVNGLNKENKKEYCKTLVKLTDEDIGRSFVAKTLAISDNKNNLERRIIMIKLSDGFKKNKELISIILVVVILVLGVLFLTKPQMENLGERKNIIENKGNDVAILSEEEALKLGKEKFEQYKNLYWSWMNNNVEKGEENSRVKEENLNNIKAMYTENGYRQFIKHWNINISDDGYCYFGEGIGANPRYISDELKIENISENQIVFKDVVKYDDEPSIKENKFVLLKIGQNWLVEDYTSPY